MVFRQIVVVLAAFNNAEGDWLAAAGAALGPAAGRCFAYSRFPAPGASWREFVEQEDGAEDEQRDQQLNRIIS